MDALFALALAFLAVQLGRLAVTILDDRRRRRRLAAWFDAELAYLQTLGPIGPDQVEEGRIAPNAVQEARILPLETKP